MPLYGFECESCENDFEELVSLSKIDDVNCPDCGSEKVHRQLSMVAGLSSGASSVGSNSGGAACSTGGG